ncbi:MAG: ATP-binding cassette domain-containing protein [Clostridium sp.]
MQLELQNVGYSYNSKELVLRHVNYRFEGGRIYAITGRSGAGKTTLLFCFHS